MQKKYNDLSSKLKSEIPKLKPGEKLRFQLNGVYVDRVTGKFVCPRSKRVLPTDRIFDPWAGKALGKGEYEGEYKDIAYIVSESPAGVDSARDSIINFGEIKFTNSNVGVIEIIGGKRNTEKLLEFIFLCNRNSANIGKPWHIKPEGKYFYDIVANDKKAKDKLARELQVDKAKQMITDMSEEEVNQAAAGLFPATYNSLGYDERVMQLRELAQKDPSKIFGASEDVGVQMTALIESALKAKIIKFNPTKTEVIWADDDTMICTIKPGQTPHNSLKRYFMTAQGAEVLASIEAMITKAKKSDNKKTAVPA